MAALAACRHEPTLGAAVQEGVNAAVALPAASAPGTCIVSEGTADREARLVCQRQCLVERMLHAQTATLGDQFPRFDAGTLLGGGQSVALLPQWDGGARWLTITELGDGGVRCDERASK